MSKKNKLFLFFLCLLFFFLITPLTIFYSQGYRFDFKEKKITQTGGLFLKVKPKKVQIYLNDRLKAETDFLFGSAFIENLLPGKYKIGIEKPGFQKWQKVLEIKEKQVTEAKNIILWPENLAFELISSKVKEFFFSPDKKRVIFLEGEGQENLTSPPAITQEQSPPVKDQSIQIKEKQNLKLYDLERGVKSHLISNDDFRKKEVEILDLSWLNSQQVLLKTSAGDEINYWILEILPQPKLISLDFLPKGIDEISFLANNSQKILLKKLKFTNLLNSLFEADLKEKKVNQKPILDDFLTYAIEEKNLFWLTPDGYLFKLNLENKIQEKLNSQAISLKKGEINLKILPKGKNLFFLEGEELFLVNQETNNFKKIFEGVLAVDFSPDNKKIAVSRGKEIWIYFLEEELSQPQRKKEDKILLGSFDKKIDELFWINSHYLALQLGEELKIIEVDNRDKPQVWNLAKIGESKYFFNWEEKRIYLQNQENFFRSEVLY